MNRRMIWGIAVLVLVLVTVTACAPKYDDESDFETEPLDGSKSVVITEYVGTKSEVRIPTKIQGLPVTAIGDNAFGNKNLTSVTIPTSVISIGTLAFAYCTSLSSISIPASITSIGLGAFGGCSNITSITIPDSVASIGGEAFDGTAWLNNQPDGLVYAGKVLYKYKGTMPANTVINNIRADTVAIAGSAFFGCSSSLTSITIPAGVTSIGDEAFYGCDSLTSVTIPAGVTSIGNFVFEGCSSLTSITIPEGVTSIGGRAFFQCKGLTSIAIPQGVTSIGDMAFFGCESLTSITIPVGVTSIGNGVFQWCTSLTNVTFETGSAITSANFGDNAFVWENSGIGSNTLKIAYLAGGAGTYARTSNGDDWSKQ